MGNLGALATVLYHGLRKENVTQTQVFDALEEYADGDKLEPLIEEVEEALKNSNAVRTAKARMEKQQTEANRTKQAVKHTKR